MSKYKFNIALPLTHEAIDRYSELNTHVTKSEVASFHGALPCNLIHDVSGYEYSLVCYQSITEASQYYDLIKHSIDNGFDFVYLLTDINGFKVDNPDLKESLYKLDNLLNNLRAIGCNKLKVTSVTLIPYLVEFAPDFELILSTIAGYKEIKQFHYLMKEYPTIKKVVMTFDSIKNITLLRNMQKLGLDVVYMVNEGCLDGCPFKQQHYMFQPVNAKNYLKTLEMSRNIQLDVFFGKCKNIERKNFWNYTIKSNIIYPNQIEEYAKYGVKEFKIAGRVEQPLVNGFQEKFVKDYLMAVDNPELALKMPAVYFNRAHWDFRYDHIKSPLPISYESVTVEDVLKFLPPLSYFEKHGHLCDSMCGYDCKYCDEQTSKFEEYLFKKYDLDPDIILKRSKFLENI